MEFLSLAVDKLLEYTVAPIARQVGYVIFYRSNVNELRKEAEALQRERERMQHEVEAAKRNGESIEGDVLDWLKEVDEMALKEVELNNDERHAKTGCSSRSFPNLLSRHQLSRQSMKMKLEIVEIKKKGKFDRVSYREVLDLMGASFSTTDSKEFGSRVSMVNDIMEALKDPNLHMIGVYGLGGVGKTTLVNEVAKIARQDKLFDEVVLVTVTNPDTTEIQQQIADKLGLRFENEGLSGRASRLCGRLNEKENRVLVILDDLWTELKLDEIGIPSVKKERALKILMTSRSREVLSDQMNTQKDFLLEVLPKKEAWELFIDEAQFDESAVSGELLLIATEVAQECAGLPLAIVTVARSLKNKSLLEWKDVLRQLQNLAPANITGTQGIIFKSIEVSYDKLENDLLKSIFLLCGVMQSNSLVMDLFKNSVGLGLFKDIYNMEEARNSLHTCIRKLKDSCLLLDSYSSKRFNMHDVIQDVAIFLASRKQHIFINRSRKLEEWPERDHQKNCKTIILDGSDVDELPQGLYYPNLTFFHLSNRRPFLDVADSFFEGMRELKVLNLAGETISSLPSSISLLSSLRALCLNLYNLGDIVIIGELKGLKVLTLSSGMTQLPPELEKLTQLQLLDLRGCYNLVLIPPKLLSSLAKLQELYMATDIYSNPIQWYVDDPDYLQLSMKRRGKDVIHSASDPNNQQNEASLAELNYLARLTTLEVRICDENMLPKAVVFERLQRYKIIIGSEASLSSEHETSRMLKLNLSTSIHSWHNVKRLLDGVEDLHLYNLKGAENVVPGINEEGMRQLKYLHLHFSDEIRTIVDSSGRDLAVDIFPNLESLVIDCAANLEKICTGPLTRGSLSRLKVIMVANCVKMKSLFPVFTVRGLPQCNLMEETISDDENAMSMLQCAELRTLMLLGLPELISFWHEDKTDSSAQQKQLLSTDMDAKMVTGDNIPYTPITLFNEKVMLPNLEEMIISDVLKLNTIWHWQQQLCPKSFDKLRKLEIGNCPELVTIFPSHIGSSMRSLETLLITNCKSLEHVFDLQGIYAKEIHSGIRGLPGVLCFPNLHQMHVEGCERLKYLFPASVAKTLGKLQRLKIEKCSMIEEIIIKEDNPNPSSSKEVMFPNLEEMIIIDVDKLNAMWHWQLLLSPNSFGKLRKIETRKCPELNFPCYILGITLSFDTLKITNLKYLEQIYGDTLARMQVDEPDRFRFLFPAAVAKSLERLRKLEMRKGSMITIEGSALPPFGEKVMFSNLEEVIIMDVEKLGRTWCWQQQRPLNSFGRIEKFEIRNCPDMSTLPSYIMSMIQNLTVMHVEGCERLKYLFPPSVAKCLGKLQRLVIDKCSMMEEIIMVEDNSHPSSSEEGKEVWHSSDLDGSLCNLRTLRVGNCEGLSKLLPFNLLKLLNNLEELEVKSCNSLEVVFDLEMGTIEDQRLAVPKSRLRKLILSSLPNLKQLWNKDPQGIVDFQSLSAINVTECDSMKYLLPASVAKSLLQLGMLKIRFCAELEHIVALEEGHDSSISFMFPQLTSFEHSGLPKLMSFYPGSYTTEWPLLKEVDYDKKSTFSGPKLLESKDQIEKRSDLSGTSQGHPLR